MSRDGVLNAGDSGVVPTQKQQALHEGWACPRLWLGQPSALPAWTLVNEDSSLVRPLVLSGMEPNPVSDARYLVAQVLVPSAHEGAGGQYLALLSQVFGGHHETSVLRCCVGSRRCFWRNGCGGLHSAESVEKNQAGNVEVRFYTQSSFVVWSWWMFLLFSCQCSCGQCY